LSLSKEDRTRLTDQLVYLDKENIIINLINQKNQYYDFFIRITYLTVISLLVITIGNPLFGTVDDNILAGFVDGSYTGEREKRLIFIRPFVGQILNILQILMPHLGVYSLFLLILLIVSFSVFGTAVFWRDENKHFQKISQISWVILSTPTVIWFSLAPTYTAVSILCTILCLVSLLTSILFNKKSYFLLFVATVTLGIGFLVRPEGAIGSIAVSILPLAYLVYKHQIINFKKVILVISILLPIFIYDNYLQANTKTSAWIKYENWNELRHQVQHRVSEDYLLDLREKNSWSIPEYHLFQDLSFGDERIFDSQWLLPAYENTKFTRNIDGILRANPLKVTQKMFSLLFNYYGLIIIQIILSIWIISRIKSTRIEKTIVILTSWFPVYLALYFMVSTLHTPERSVYPLFLLPNILLVTQSNLFQEKHGSIISRKIWTPLIFLSVFLLFYSTHGLGHQFSLNRSEKESAAILEKELNSLGREVIFIGPGNSELYDRRNPYLAPAQWSQPKMITAGNWETFSPHWYKRIDFLGVTGNSIYESLFNENIYWLGSSVPDTAYIVELFLNENGYPDANRENIANFSHGEALFKYLPN